MNNERIENDPWVEMNQGLPEDITEGTLKQICQALFEDTKESQITTGVTLKAAVYHPDQISKDTHFFSFDRDTRLHTAIKYSW